MLVTCFREEICELQEELKKTTNDVEAKLVEETNQVCDRMSRTESITKLINQYCCWHKRPNMQRKNTLEP